MSDFVTNWTRDELKAYLLIFCANADFVETKEESDMIHSKVSDSKYTKLHDEFEHDNDYKSIQKIESTIKRFNYSDSEIDALAVEIKELFLVDGKFDILEKNLMMGLNKIIRD